MLKVGDKVRVRSLTVPKGYDFSYNYGIGCIGKVIDATNDKNVRSIIVNFGGSINQEWYYEDDLDLIEEDTLKTKIKKALKKCIQELEEMEK